MAARSPLVTLAGLLSCVALSRAGQGWTYEGDNGPDHWSRLGYKECDHHQQSPIDIHSRTVVLRHLDPVELRFFDHAPLKMNVTNTFIGAAVTMESRHVPLVRAGSLAGEYQVVGFHFHWGENDTVGSEHVLDGRSYPLEMHILCKNAKYADMEKATQRPDGLAVLAVWFEVGSTPNSGLIRLAPALRRVTAGGTSTLLPNPPSLLELMPADTGHFYRYEGSLTTPGCYEVVTWTVFKHSVKATEAQLALFRALNGLRKPIGHNYRFVQRAYGRTVYERRALDEVDGGGGGGAATLVSSRNSGLKAVSRATATRQHPVTTAAAAAALWLGLTGMKATIANWRG